MKKIVNRVTVTGADDGTSIKDMVLIQEEYPFVEWGILFSKSNEGRPRFPTTEWVEGLVPVKDTLGLSAHLCGRWVRDICKGNNTFHDDRPQFKGLFGRYQLNFHAYLHQIQEDALVDAIGSLGVSSVILQFDDVNNDLLETVSEKALQKNTQSVVPLFDTSGGAGVLPEEWPKAL